MRGSIKQRGKSKSKWSVVLEINKDPVTNKRRQKWYTVEGTKKDAEKFLTEKQRELDTGVFIDSKDILLKDYLDYWYNEYCVPNLSPMTYESYEYNIKMHINPIIGNIKLKDLMPLDLQEFYANRMQKGLSKSSALQLHRIIHSALEQAMKWQLVIRNVADNVTRPKPEKYKAKVLNEQEVIKLIEVIETTDIYVPVMIAISTRYA